MNESLETIKIYLQRLGYSAYQLDCNNHINRWNIRRSETRLAYLCANTEEDAWTLECSSITLANIAFSMGYSIIYHPDHTWQLERDNQRTDYFSHSRIDYENAAIAIKALNLIREVSLF